MVDVEGVVEFWRAVPQKPPYLHPADAIELAELAQLGTGFPIPSQVAMNQIKELSTRECLFRRVVPTKRVDGSWRP